ncbi:MAG: response regulator [Treponema sp.]|jgi:signal transduction histidine kinase/DNA-binding response OmpR family regulator|nr:response regulator [Treponema sp.]
MRTELDLFPEGSFAYTSALLSREGQGALWEYYQETNRLFIYGRSFIKDIYGLDAAFMVYDLTEYLETFCQEDCAASIIDMFKKALADCSGYDHIHHIRHQDWGTYRMIHAIGIIRDTGQGRIICGCLQDICHGIGSEQHFIQAEVKRQVRLLLDVTPTACMFWNDRYMLVNCNKKALELFQCSSKEDLYQRFLEFSPEYQPDGSKSREKRIACLRKAMESGMEVYEWWYRLPSGESLPVEVALVRIFWDGGYCIASHIRDLRPFKEYLHTIEQTQQKLIAARNEAEESDRVKSEFLAHMSHEIRTPMTGILGMTKLLLQSGITEKQRFYSTAIDQSAKHLLRIIDDILDFSMINTGKLSLEQVPFSLQKTLGEALDAVLPELKTLTMTLTQEPGIPDTLIGDPLRLTQVLVHLLDNGIKFTKQGSISLGIRQKDPAERDVGTFEFSITDTGIGMTAEQVTGLFVPFVQADSSLTRQYGGTGLGLTICKNLVTLMAGSITCESAGGQGTTVRFTVPLGIAASQEPPVYHQAAGKRIFALMEDAPSGRALGLQCQILGGAFLGFSTEKDTWEEALPPDPDVILISWTEIRFRIKDALERLSRRYGTARPGLLILVGDHGDHAGINALDASCQVLYKPVSTAVLYRHIMDLPTPVVEKAQPVDPLPVIPDHIRGAHVLLVEDNEINQIMASELLIMEGFKVDIASNGREAVEMVAQHDYDIVLMDIQMPEMDGLTATRLIRQRANTIPILALTAHALAFDREKSLAAGMNDHITKPIDHRLLFRAMARWVHPHPRGGCTA